MTITVDGSIGGGSVLRVAVPLALASDKQVKVINIRKHRDRPGLRTQHLLGLQALATLTGSQVDGLRVGSAEVAFVTGATEPVDAISIPVSTAASLSLIIQAISNYCFVSGRTVSLLCDGGGTHTSWAPTMDYVEQITKPTFKQFGQTINLQIDRYGFYPKGGAKMEVSISQEKKTAQLVGGMPTQIDLYSIASKGLQKRLVADRLVRGFKEAFDEQQVIEHSSYVSTLDQGCALLAVVKHQDGYRGYDRLGQKGITAESIGKAVASKVDQELDAGVAVDRHMADQLLVPVACSAGKASFTCRELTEHMDVNMRIISDMMGDVLAVEEMDKGYRIHKN